MNSWIRTILVLWIGMTSDLWGQTPPLPPAEAMRPVGLVGGLSWHSTVDYYRLINQAVNDRYGNNTNPPLLLWNVNQARIHELQNRNQWDEIARIMSEAAKALQQGGARAILLCSNTSHKVYSKVAAQVDVPVLHIGDATGRAIQRKGLKKVGLIGTRFTMEDGFLKDWLRDRYSIETLIPDRPDDRLELHRIIQHELGMGIFKPGTKAYILAQIDTLRRRGAEGIILGCTEFSLIIHPEDVSFPSFDTTALHAEMAVDFILRVGNPVGTTSLRLSLPPPKH